MIKVRQKKITEGTTKTLFDGPESGLGILSFSDKARQWNSGAQVDDISGKGILNNRISAHLMTCLESIGLPTHFLKSLNMREQEVKIVDPLSIRLVVRNVAAGSMADRLDLPVGTILPRPIIEFYYKKDSQNYSIITEDHIVAFQWGDPFEMEEIVTMAYRANDFMNGLFSGIGVRLVDFSIEFGRLWGEYGELYIMICDELSPDTMRLWDLKTNQPFEGGIEAYQEIAVRLGLIPREGLVTGGDVNETMAEKLDAIENILANNEDRKIRAITKMPPRKGTPRG